MSRWPRSNSSLKIKRPRIKCWRLGFRKRRRSLLSLLNKMRPWGRKFKRWDTLRANFKLIKASSLQLKNFYAKKTKSSMPAQPLKIIFSNSNTRPPPSNSNSFICIKLSAIKTPKSQPSKPNRLTTRHSYNNWQEKTNYFKERLRNQSKKRTSWTVFTSKTKN